MHGAYAELRQYVTLYTRLQRDVRRQKTLIRNVAGQLFPELSRIFKGLTGVTALAMLRNHAAASVVRELTQEAFIAGVRADFRGRWLQTARLCRAYVLAQHSVGLTEGVEALQLALRLHIEALEVLEQQLEEVYTALVGTFQALPESGYLLSVRGLGIIMAATILSEIGDPSHYTQRPATDQAGRDTARAEHVWAQDPQPDTDVP